MPQAPRSGLWTPHARRDTGGASRVTRRMNDLLDAGHTHVAWVYALDFEYAYVGDAQGVCPLAFTTGHSPTVPAPDIFPVLRYRLAETWEHGTTDRSYWRWDLQRDTLEQYSGVDGRQYRPGERMRCGRVVPDGLLCWFEVSWVGPGRREDGSEFYW